MLRYINEVIEDLLHTINDTDIAGLGSDQTTPSATHNGGNSISDVSGHYNHTNSNNHSSVNQDTNETSQCNTLHQEPSHVRHADWARVLEAATQRRTEVLMPENLENMWTRGWDYKKKESPNIKASSHETSTSKCVEHTVPEGKPFLRRIKSMGTNHLQNVGPEISQDFDKELLFEGVHRVNESKDTMALLSNKSKIQRKRPDSVYHMGSSREGGPIFSEFNSHDFERQNVGFRGMGASDIDIRKAGQLVPKIHCRVRIYKLRMLNETLNYNLF